MIELKYNERTEEADLAGQTVAEARQLFQETFGLTDKAVATLNGRKIDRAGEAAAVLNDDDELTFDVTGRKRLAYMVGALLLALGLTGGIFAYGFNNATLTLGATAADANFAEVTANASSPPDWSVSGMQFGATGNGTLFDIDTTASGYTGDLVATVSLANTGQLANIYRSLNMSLEVRDSAGNLLDINSDGNVDSADYTMLTLENSAVVINITQGAADVYTVMLRNGSYRSNVRGGSWSPAEAAPMLYCEIAQR